MPPIVALAAALGLVVWLFRQDKTEAPVGSPALWFAAIWLLIESTRPVDYWLPETASRTAVEGSPVDQLVLGALLLGGLITLGRRGWTWGAFVAANLSIVAIYSYWLGSCAWAEFPVAVIKRLIKDSAVIVFSLVFLTELDPGRALRKIFLRCSFIVFPLSIVAIKYYPAIGTSRARDGDKMFTGLTTQKNSLGEVTFTYLLILLWDLKQLRVNEGLSWRDPRVRLRLIMIGMGGWLLLTSQSKTSLLCLLIGLGIYGLSGRLRRKANPRLKLVALLMSVLIFYGLDSTFHITETIVTALGRNMTFTGRTGIWSEVLAQPVNPVVGSGFMMFWDGPYGRTALDEMGVKINSAHNGYLDLFLDGGACAIFLLGVMLIARGKVIIDRWAANEFWGRMGLIFWVVSLVYNFSETSYFRLDILWFLLMFSMIRVPEWWRHERLGAAALTP